MAQPILKKIDQSVFLFYQKKKYKLKVNDISGFQDEVLIEDWDIMLSDNEQPFAVTYNGIDYAIKLVENQSNRREGNNATNQGQNTLTNRRRLGTATAPYNFIPLNEKVIYASDDDKHEKLSGFIDLNITNLTHLFIGSSNNDNYQVGNHLAIPGSSLRGMLRSLVEIVSYGKFVNSNLTKRLYIRPFADVDSKAKTFFQNEVGEEGLNIKVGFLNFDSKKNEYFLYEAAQSVNALERIFENGKTFLHEMKSDGTVNLYTGKMDNRGNPKKHWKIDYRKKNDQRIYIDDSVISDYRNDSKRNITKDGIMKNLLKHAKLGVREMSLGIPIFFSLDKDQLVKSLGHCRYYRIPYDKTIGDDAHISTDHKKNERYDITESIFGSLDIKEPRAGKVFVEDSIGPVKTGNVERSPLQILSNPNPSSYQLYLEQGNARYYDELNSWTQKTPIRGYKFYWHKNTNKMSNRDLNWRKLTYTDRVFAQIVGMRPGGLHKLQSENQSDFEIVQDPSTSNRNRKLVKLKKRFEELSPFLQKKFDLYYQKENKKSQFKIIDSIKPNQLFKGGRIRFENLSQIELGAILFCLNLPEGSYHKIGMGKPHGLGTIKITHNTILINRKSRYDSIFKNQDNWNESTQKVVDEKEYIDSFEAFLSENGIKTPLWSNNARIQNLALALYYNEETSQSDNWLKGTQYQKLKEFRGRSVLPAPDKVAHSNRLK